MRATMTGPADIPAAQLPGASPRCEPPRWGTPSRCRRRPGWAGG